MTSAAAPSRPATPRFERVAVLGSGVMGATIAAHLANAGLSVLLLDLVPTALAPEEAAAGRTLADPAVRSRLAAAAVAGLARLKPSPLYLAADAARIEPGNLEDHLPRLAACDWVIEVVVENMAVKKALLAERIAPHLKPGAVLSSNTSGLSVNELAEALPAALRPRFLVTHFFNPPRYMRLVEVVSSRHTDPAVAAGVSDFLSRRLGKGIVIGKDTPNFVANRVGVFSMCNAIHHMVALGLTVEEVDAVSGPATARPKSACFRTADLVGLDTLAHVARNSYDLLPSDERRDTFQLPPFVGEMVKQGLLGNKARQGFFKKTRGEKPETLFLDWTTGQYAPSRRPRPASVEAAKGLEDPAARVRTVLAGKDPAAELAWRNLRDTLLYAFHRIPEIADDVVAVDRAMRWGFNWELGPFELFDAIGVAAFVARAEADGVPVPAALRGVEAFYAFEGGRRRFLDLATRAWREVEAPPDVVDLTLLRRAGREVERSPGASVLDLGDGVFCLEFHAKMNAIGADTLAMFHKAIHRAETEGQGLVIGNQGPNFSAGANLALLLAAIAEGAWDEVDLQVRAFQRALMAVKYARVPVVAAPHGLSLGGGCETSLHAAGLAPHAETYMGLVEVGVGLLPAGGGTKELALRAIRLAEQFDTDVSPFIFKHFSTIATAKVSTSAAELAGLGFLRHGDQVSLSADHQLHDAKLRVLALAATWRPAQPATGLAAPGRGVAASLVSQLWNMRMGGFITPYEEVLGKVIAGVITGGDVPAGTPITEQWLLDLEREAFVSLCGRPQTQQRIQHMLQRGKPLRN
ncbi:MAG: enoyl-CoA hydratase/isomerase family protein [Anaeromyxobacter sp.]|nr:enoyl-CoA hydratase/isomerase family protein [Anaeromyxobacter sp.]MBL0276715.1 enoyl-CoA hydratase/isomerase family protein [Anaeromyxobacter sp.]